MASQPTTSDPIGVKVITFKTAESFLNALGRRNRLWGPNPEAWLFRGHGDASWPLVPTLLRNGVSCAIVPLRRPMIPESHLVQVKAEYAILNEYAHRLAQSGYAIPGFGSQWFAAGFDAEIERRLFAAISGELPWLLEEFLPLAASAQHSGLPTRLLDWSIAPLSAAYFAATHAARQMVDKAERGKDGPKVRGCHLAVWALDRFLLRRLPQQNQWGRGKPKPGDFFAAEISTPWSDHPNIKAQQGVFLLCREFCIAETPVCRDPIDVRLGSLIGRLGLETKVDKLFVKLMLPYSQARRLLRLLHIEGFNYSRLFPGYEGVAKALLERRLFDDVAD